VQYRPMPQHPGRLATRRSGTARRQRVALAACFTAAIGLMLICSGPPVIATAADAGLTGAATAPSLQSELSHLGTVKFSTRLQDAADENVFEDLPIVVTISDVIDTAQCHISYQQRVEREGASSDERRSLTLGDIDAVKIEPFESFENEHQGQPGLVYTLTEPEISAVVVTHQAGAVDWFAIIGVEAANRLAGQIRRRGDYCRRHLSK